MGDLSQLLAEIAQAPADGDSWREPLKPGDEVGRYQIRREIGRGGFGAVYEAFDPQLGRVVALKALKPGRSKHPVSEEWIQKEAEAVAKLDHPAIVTIFDVGTCPGGAYLVMELLRGETLARRIEQGPLPVDEALRIAEQMAEGLAHAHSRGVLHRDLKPANVFVCEDGRVKLLDFGLAHLLGTEGSSGAGTPAYMAPEQASGAAVDERADVWAAGMVLGEMLTGKRPVERTPTPAAGAEETKTALLWEAPKEPVSPGTPPALARMPRPVAKTVGAALAEDPAARPRDGSAWLSELRSARLRKDRPRRARRVALLAGIGAIVGLVLAALATWRIWERQIPGGRPTVAVADFANETGDPELDSISGLLITSLEQGTQLRVLTRGRMLGVLKRLGKEDVRRIDEPLAREVGQETRANALLLGSVRKLGAAYVVEMRALDPLHDEYLFTVSDRAAGKDGIFNLVDRLGASTRKRLGAVDGAAAPPARVAAITTENVKAWELLSESRRAFDRDELAESKRLAEEALKEDPDFPLAHYQLAIATHWLSDGSPDQAQKTLASLEAAERRAAHLPEKERLSLEALHAQLDGRLNEATQLWDRAAQAYPLDKDVLLHAGDVRYHRHDMSGSLPYFERVLQLEPAQTIATKHLLQGMVQEGTSRRNLAWLEEKARTSRNPGELASVAWALLDAGREELAIETWTRSQDMKGRRFTPPVYARHLVLAGRAPEAEERIRQDLANLPASAKPRVVTLWRLLLSLSLIGQGRFAEALAGMDGPQDPESEGVATRVYVSLASGDPAGVRKAILELERMGELEDLNALVGYMIMAAAAEDTVTLSRLAEKASASPQLSQADEPSRAWLAPAIAWGRGSREEARQGFAALASQGHVAARFWGPFFLGTLARQDGNCALAVAEMAKAWNGGIVYPADDRIAVQSVLLFRMASCHEKLGEFEKARARNDELLRRWARADPDAPLLAEAKALQARLASAR